MKLIFAVKLVYRLNELYEMDHFTYFFLLVR